ncbi:hypothetical protein JG687_00005217 [Phytophthora cactorum]|uniref:Uncharacterized protein n=1 Tax=Phytophthora cactorum TaxID=29920 RepID=A0A8T1UPE9_9STRA|nr:hypothetical protein JG687_00005217 [Phytophthora cactorum]
MAKEIVSYMANKVELAQWMDYYRSPTWRVKQPDAMPCASLAPKRLYRRGRGKICVADRIYNKPWKQ